MIIYKATNNINGVSYIGQTTRTLSKRKQSHISYISKSTCYFHNALNKYGKDNFTWEILCECNTKEELDEMEFHYIKQYDTFNNGYNLTFGYDKGTYGYKHTDKSILKMSKNSKGIVPWNKGISHTEETKQKISKRNKDNIAWNKGLSVDDDRVMNNIKKRNKTMREKGLYKTGRSHPKFIKLDEKLLIILYNKGISHTKIGTELNVSRQVISRRISLLKSEGKL